MPTGGTTTVESAADPIYRELRAAIVDGSLAGGIALRQDEIARKHGVSKIPVREALQRLEAEGLVHFLRNRGAFVRQLSAVEVLQLIDIRVALECRALELAIPHMIPADLNAMHDLLKAYAEETQVSKWSEFNLRFHTMLYEPCGNPHLIAMIADIHERIGPYQRQIVTEATGLERPMREHDDILMACTNGDVETAVGVLRQHIETTKKEVAAYMRRLA